MIIGPLIFGYNLLYVLVTHQQQEYTLSFLSLRPWRAESQGYSEYALETPINKNYGTCALTCTYMYNTAVELILKVRTCAYIYWPSPSNQSLQSLMGHAPAMNLKLNAPQLRSYN